MGFEFAQFLVSFLLGSGLGLGFVWYTYVPRIGLGSGCVETRTFNFMC